MFRKKLYSLQVCSKHVTEIETHSKMLQVVKRDVWKKENIVKNERTKYKMIGQFADRLIMTSISKKYTNGLRHVGGVQKGGNIATDGDSRCRTYKSWPKYNRYHSFNQVLEGVCWSHWRG